MNTVPSSLNPDDASFTELLTVVSNRLHIAHFPFTDIWLDGSYRSGMALHSTPSASKKSDVDIVVTVPPQISIDDRTCEQFAEILKGTHRDPRSLMRWGEPHTVAHISAAAPNSPPALGTIDYWLTTAPFITVSPFWKILFTPEEIQWQRAVRNTLANTVSDAPYNEFKALCLAEARWRMIACYGAQLISGLTAREELLLEETPLKAPIPASLRKFALRWASGDLSDSWLIRPLVLLNFESKEILRFKGEALQEPEAPVWVDVLSKLQDRQVTKRYQLAENHENNQATAYL